MSNERAERCATCKWFAPYPPPQYEDEWYKQHLIEREGTGPCRASAPFHNGWPITWGDFFCGSWKDKKELTATITGK